MGNSSAVMDSMATHGGIANTCTCIAPALSSSLAMDVFSLHLDGHSHFQFDFSPPVISSRLLLPSKPPNPRKSWLLQWASIVGRNRLTSITRTSLTTQSHPLMHIQARKTTHIATTTLMHIDPCSCKTSRNFVDGLGLLTSEPTVCPRTQALVKIARLVVLFLLSL